MGATTLAPLRYSVDIVDIVCRYKSISTQNFVSWFPYLNLVDIIQSISTQNLVSDTVLVTIMEGDGTFAAVYEDTLASGAGQATLGPGLLLLLLLAGQSNTVC